MDCLRSFTIVTRATGTFTTPDIKQWTTGANQHFWTCDIDRSSTYNIQGFKNIDIYGVTMIGGITAQVPDVNNGVNVEDFNFGIYFQGQLPLLGGNITSDYWQIQDTGIEPLRFQLSKNTNSIKFSSPIKSTQFIQFVHLKAQGNGYQTLSTISLDWDLSFTFYYKFEGE